MTNLTKEYYDAFHPKYFSVKHVWWLAGDHGKGGLTAQGITAGPTEYYDSEEDAARALRKFKRKAKK
jgi:hypothetical protein